MNFPVQFDVIVIGGGAAGLMAATASSQMGKRTLLVEKNRKLGVKILMSGGTRCNITHHCDTRDIVAAFGKQGNFLYSALASLSPQDVVQRMHAQGVPTKVEETGKIFPVSNRAIDVRDALVRDAAESGAILAHPQSIQSISYTATTPSTDGPRFTVASETNSWTAQSVIITTGGVSYPGCGTTGDGYPWARQFGHSIVTPVPALVPLLSRCDWANELKGITIPDASVSVWEPPAETAVQTTPLGLSTRKKQKPKKLKPLAKRKGSFLFTHWGFSGPSVLDVSREVARHLTKNRLQLVCDFLPGRKSETLTQQLIEKKQQSGKQVVGNLLAEALPFPKRLSDALLEGTGLHRLLRNAELSNSQLHRLVDQVKRCQFGIQGTLGFEKAEVTAGGVELREIDSKTMQSKLQPGLFFAGEVLDLDGFIGGFNFQSAFSTGWLAGLSAGSAST